MAGRILRQGGIHPIRMETYWQIWVFRENHQLSVYCGEVSPSFMFDPVPQKVLIKKIIGENQESREIDYTGYISIFQNRWRAWRRMRKQFFRYLRMREINQPCKVPSLR